MNHTVRFEHLTATISTLGATLTSLKDHAKDEEYIWQAEPAIWQGSAPILFPIVGRLKDGQYHFNKKTYQLDKHGFARTSEFSVLEAHDSSIRFILRANAQTTLVYPFDFELVVTFKLDKNALHVNYQVNNVGNDTMYFTLGSHPAFRLPLNNSALEDYYLEFESNETLDCYFLDHHLLTENPIKAYLNNTKVVPITDQLFENDALIFKNIQSHKVYLKHHKNGFRLAMTFDKAPHFALWSKPNAPFICLEPWFSYDDSISADGDIRHKPGIIQLGKQETFTTAYAIQIAEQGTFFKQSRLG